MREDQGTTTKHFARIRHGLGMIPTTDRHNAGTLCVLQFGKDLVERSAYFECAGGLKQFQLEINIRAKHLAQSATANRWRAFDVFSDAFACLLDVVEGDHLLNDDRGECGRQQIDSLHESCIL